MCSNGDFLTRNALLGGVGNAELNPLFPILGNSTPVTRKRARSPGQSGSKKFGMALETQGTQTLGRISRNVSRISRGGSKSLRKKVRVQSVPSQTMKTLTSLNKEVRPSFLSDNSLWSLPSVFSLNDHRIWRS